MINTSAKYKQELIKGNRNYVAKVEITLADNTPLTLTNENIWEQGIVISQAISSDDSFDVGSAIVGSLKVVIDNINGSYNTYDFMNAHLTLWLGVENDTDLGGNQIFYRIGFYVVDDTEYNGSLITLSCLDNMTWFDVPFSKVNFPTTSNTTAGQLVTAICSYVGVALGTTQFPNYTTTIYRQSLLNLAENDYNCREILQFVAQKCCCYCKINTAGQLVLKWHDKQAIIGIHNYDGGSFSTHTTPYSDGDEVDGMLFNPWNQGVEYNGGLFTDLQNNVWLSQNFDIRVSTDDITVTGCVIRSTLGQEDDHYDVIWVDSTLESTKPRYALVIENNPLILKAEAENIANTVGNTLAYLPIRGFESRSLSDFSYETGDMATIVDFRGNFYYTWLTHFTFTINNSETFGCGVQSIRNRNESRFSTAVQTMLNADKVLSDYDKAVKAMNELAANAIGYREYYYPSEATALDSRVTYRYNGTTIDTTIPSKPKFPNSTVVFKIAGDGVFVSRSKDSQGYPVFDNGYDANSGTAILNLLYAQGLNANWIKAGTIDTARLNVSGIVTGINSGSTTIDGGKISTDSITASQIAANAISTSELAANAVTAAKIQVGAVGADQIAANAVTAGKINVNNLKAINVNIGPWIIDDAGFTNNSDAWVKPMEISCGKYGGTLIGMRGKESGNNSGYLEVGVNASSDYIHVFYDSIERSDGKYAYFWDGSDKRLKKNIKELSANEAHLIIDNSRPVSFRYKAHDEIKQYGVIAQDVDAQCEKLGLENPFVRDNERGDNMKIVDYIQFIAPLIKVVQDQQKQIDSLKAELADLKARIK